MQHEFWHERWQQNQIGFHKQEVNPFLQRYWAKLQNDLAKRIFVPLCGKSNDLLWLRTLGHQVVGVELSPLAVDAFFSENRLQPLESKQGHFHVSEIDGLQILCGDFFALHAADLGTIAAVYDRASLVALPPELRVEYAIHLATLVSPKTQILLIAFDYPQHEMAGPPFSVNEEEIDSLFGNWCDIELLASEDVLEQEERFKQRGLSRMKENIYHLRVR
ncbi:MAG: thiopurine S-methyltransferase [Methylomonas sp.]|nr:thiopurine S-methyltransferase [Methylomonas sp.]